MSDARANGEVLAFTVGNTCLAWWSKEQLRRLAERRQQGKRAQEQKWSGVKGPAGQTHLLTTPPEPRKDVYELGPVGELQLHCPAKRSGL